MRQKVLVIDHVMQDMQIIRRLIEDANLEPVSATSLTQAKLLFGDDLPEHYLCALVEYSLPDAPAGQAIDFSIGAFISTIATTDRLDESTRQQVLSRAVVDYIPKHNAQIFTYLRRLLQRLQRNKHIGILVVCPEREERTRLCQLLGRHNFLTYGAMNARQGLAQLSRHGGIKLVLTHTTLPDMDGMEWVAMLRNQYPKESLAIIGLARGDDDPLAARLLKSGANDYLLPNACHEAFFYRVNLNIELLEYIHTIQCSANTDYLTGIANRRHFFNQLTPAVCKPAAPWPIALFDLDHFKQINDTLGHDVGDEVLKAVAKLLDRHFSPHPLCRFGGEEFCVAMPDLSLTQAFELVESFRKTLATTEGHYLGHPLAVTVSVGLAEVGTDGDIDAALKIADQCLYGAKKQGRNRVSRRAP